MQEVRVQAQLLRCRSALANRCPPLPGVQYRNVNMNPAKHATYQRLLALKECFWHADLVSRWAVPPPCGRVLAAPVNAAARSCLQVLVELEGLVSDDVSAFLPVLLSGLHIEVLLHGNIAAAEAEQLARQLHTTLGGTSLAADARPVERCRQLPKGCSMLNRCGKLRVQAQLPPPSAVATPLRRVICLASRGGACAGAWRRTRRRTTALRRCTCSAAWTRCRTARCSTWWNRWGHERWRGSLAAPPPAVPACCLRRVASAGNRLTGCAAAAVRAVL